MQRKKGMTSLPDQQQGG